MASLAKKIRKTLVKTGNAVCINASDEIIKDMSEHFPSVFVLIQRESLFKKKNIIYRESFDDLNKLPEIRFIYVGRESVEDIPKIKNFIEQYQPVLILETNEWLNKKHSRILAELRYQIIDKQKHWQLWTLPR